MSRIKFDLPAIQDEFTAPDTIQGKYILVDDSNGQFDLIVGNNPAVTVDRNTRVTLPEQEGTQDLTIRVRNRSGVANSVLLEVSNFPIVKKVATEISETVQIAPNQEIGIDQTRNGVQLIAAQLNALTAAIGASADITIQPNQSVEIDHDQVELVQTITRETTAGTIAAGAKQYSIISIGGNDYEVDGVVIPSSVSIEMEHLAKGETYPEITYDPTAAAGAELLILEVR